MPGPDWVPGPGPDSVTPGLRLFAADSVWNTPVAANSELDPTSDQRVGELAGTIETQISRNRLYPDFAAESYSSPLYIAPDDAPTSRVTLDTGSWGRYLQAALDEGVPIPPDAQPANGSDGHLSVYQPSTDTLWEFWRAVRRDDGWHASWGGAMRGVSADAGHYSATAWPGLPSGEGWNWGSTATSLPVVAGMATIEELRRGRVDHALAMNVPNPCKGYFSWPAQRQDGYSESPDCMPEGARLRLDPDLDLQRFQMPRVTRILAEAAQRYGIVVRDRTQATGSVALFGEPGAAGEPSPYTGSGGLFEGVPRWKLLSSFPWRDLQLLPLQVCTRLPCRQMLRDGDA